MANENPNEYGLRELAVEGEMTIYRPFAQVSRPDMTIVMRTAGDPTALTSVIASARGGARSGRWTARRGQRAAWEAAGRQRTRSPRAPRAC